MSRTYTSRDIADALGISLDTFYRSRARLESDEGMPKPICSGGRHRYERAGFDYWLTRHHPARPPRAANDVSIVPDPATDDEHRARLALAYAPRREAAS